MTIRLDRRTGGRYWNNIRDYHRWMVQQGTITGAEARRRTLEFTAEKVFHPRVLCDAPSPPPFIWAPASGSRILPANARADDPTPYVLSWMIPRGLLDKNGCSRVHHWSLIRFRAQGWWSRLLNWRAA